MEGRYYSSQGLKNEGPKSGQHSKIRATEGGWAEMREGQAMCWSATQLPNNFI